MKQGFFTITDNTGLAPNTYRMVLAGDTSAITAPGQFVQVSVPGKFLRARIRRPFEHRRVDQIVRVRVVRTLELRLFHRLHALRLLQFFCIAQDFHFQNLRHRYLRESSP